MKDRETKISKSEKLIEGIRRVHSFVSGTIKRSFVKS